MKSRTILSLLSAASMLFIPTLVHAQWSLNGTNTYTNPLTNKVGIGITIPTQTLDIFANNPAIRVKMSTITPASYAAVITESNTASVQLVQLMGGSTMTGTLFGVNRKNTGQFYTNNAPLAIGTGQGYDLTFGTNGIANLTIKNGGNVGIGTQNPIFAKLVINPATTINNTPDHLPGISIEKETGGGSKRRLFIVPHVGGGGYNQLSRDGDLGIFWTDGVATGGQNSTGGLVIAPHAYPNNGIRITSQGNVGIGTALDNNPNNYKLAINGTIGAKAVKVEVSSSTWADYVFEKEYKLKSIQDLEAFITTHKHLPNVPSACEVEKDGIDMATMDAKLLEKIEELSLYIIEQNKRIELLEQKIK